MTKNKNIIILLILSTLSFSLAQNATNTPPPRPKHDMDKMNRMENEKNRMERMENEKKKIENRKDAVVKREQKIENRMANSTNTKMIQHASNTLAKLEKKEDHLNMRGNNLDAKQMLGKIKPATASVDVINNFKTVSQNIQSVITALNTRFATNTIKVTQLTDAQAKLNTANTAITAFGTTYANFTASSTPETKKSYQKDRESIKRQLETIHRILNQVTKK